MEIENEQPPKPHKNGLAIRSLSDAVAFATLLALFLGVCAWGLKLEGRNDALNLRVNNLEVVVAQGILPRADERVSYNSARIEDNRHRVERLESYHRNGNK